VRFFKNSKEYICAGNSAKAEGSLEVTRRERDWQRSWRAYWAHLDKIADRLGPKAYKQFRFETDQTSLHDAFLLSMSFGDLVSGDSKAYARLRFAHGPSTVLMQLLNYEKSTLHIFEFKRPRKLVVDAPSSVPLYFRPGTTLGQIYHYEICAVSPELLQIEWLLDSGGVIQIHFEKLIYRTKRINGVQ
jgi:hypothetical protein